MDEGGAVSSRLRRRLGVSSQFAWTSVAVLVLLVASVWAALSIPMDVPDTGSPPIGNHVSDVNNSRTVGQSFVAERDGLKRISLILATKNRTSQAEISLSVREEPGGEPMRTVKRQLSQLPEGNPMDMGAGLPTEHWETFEFEPIPDSAGRQLYFSIQGHDMHLESSVQILTFFHNGYSQGQAYHNDEPLNAHLAFRTYSRSQGIDLLSTIAGNLSSDRPGLLSSPVTYALLAVLYLLTSAVLIRRIWQEGLYSETPS